LLEEGDQAIAHSSQLCESHASAVKESIPMFGKKRLILSALCVATLPVGAAAQSLDSGSQDAAPRDGISQGRSETGGSSYGDRNRGGRSGFYSFPSHRSVDDGSSALAERSFSRTDAGTSPYSRNTHGSAYYGRDYGAPYFGGGYYDQGVYYRERRDR
jgi:hypothetical protein